MYSGHTLLFPQLEAKTSCDLHHFNSKMLQAFSDYNGTQCPRRAFFLVGSQINRIYVDRRLKQKSEVAFSTIGGDFLQYWMLIFVLTKWIKPATTVTVLTNWFHYSSVLLFGIKFAALVDLQAIFSPCYYAFFIKTGN